MAAENRRIRPLLLGITAGVIGLIAAVAVDVIERSVVDVPTALLAVGAFLVLYRFHANLTVLSCSAAASSGSLSSDRRLTLSGPGR